MDLILSFPGHKCPTDGMVNATQCPDGEYQTDTGQSSCDDCPAGSECSDTTTANPCSTGQYSDAKAISCTSCPTGEFWLFFKSVRACWPRGTGLEICP